MTDATNESIPEPFLPHDACPALFTKTKALNSLYVPSPAEVRWAADVAIFWCLKTMREQGPDDADVSPAACRPGRSCYCSPTA